MEVTSNVIRWLFETLKFLSTKRGIGEDSKSSSWLSPETLSASSTTSFMRGLWNLLRSRYSRAARWCSPAIVISPFPQTFRCVSRLLYQY